MRTVDFPSLAGQWSPVTAAHRLKPGKMLDILFDGIPVVFFRDEQRKLCALVNRCPHRSVKLSLGKLQKDGTLQCSFHGWRFDGTGSCRSIPLNPDAKLSSVKAQSLACEEREGLLWVFCGEPSDAPPLKLPEPLDQGRWYGSLVERDWPVHWSRSVQTSLDVAHVPFTHPKSIGVAFGRALGKDPTSRLSYDVKQHPDGGFHMHWSVESASDNSAKDSGWVAFHPPNGMSLGIPQNKPENRSILFIWSVPIDENNCRTIVLSRRNFGCYNPIPLLYDLLTPLILAEDRRNLETSWPSEVPDSGQEISMPADAPSIAFQRYYNQYRARSTRKASETESEFAAP